MNFSGRLIITKVILENFKSYAGITQIGPFHTSFTAVVGPNGSGKSNLLESLLFAFGKRAKKMRLNKISELIHKSKAYPNLKYAKVEVYFENIEEIGSHCSTVINSCVILSRIVFQNNTSIYKINNIETSYESATALLKSRGIDLEHNRFLILQGEVEQIAMMKPKSIDGNKNGLLEYLEEIIGSDIYIEEIQAIEKEIEDISEKIASKKLHLDQATKAVEALVEPMQLAVVCLDYQKQLMQYKNLKFQIYRNKNITDIQLLKQENDKNDTDLDIIEKEYTRIKEINDTVVNEFESKASELKSLKKQESLFQAQLVDLLKLDMNYTENIYEIKSKIKGFVDETEIEKKRLSEIEKNVNEINSRLPMINNRLLDIKEDKENTEKEFNKLNSEIMGINQKYFLKKEELEKEIIPLKRELIKFKQDIDANKQKILEYQNENINKEEEKIRFHQDIKEISSEISNKITEKQEITKKLEDSVEIVTAISSEIMKNQQILSDLSKKINKYKRIINDIENDEQFKDSTSRLIREIYDAKQKGYLKGIIGRLGDLGIIDPLYNIAISSASNMFDYIVVEKVVDGENLIKFVREKTLGKVNIIILEKIQHLNYKDFAIPDKRAERLFDLITFRNNNVVDAFYLALRDTLVTNTLEEARTIAFNLSKRWKVVTLSGDVINPSGEMMGFTRPMSNKMRLSTNKSDTDYNVKDKTLNFLKKTSEEFEKIGSHIKTLEGNLSVEQKNINHIKDQLKILEDNIKIKQENLLNMNFRLKTLNSRENEFTEADINKFNEITEQNEKTIKKLEQVMKIKESEINKIDKLIEEQGGDNFKEIKKKKNYLIQVEEKIEQDINKETKKICQFQKDMERYKQNLEQLGENIKMNSSKLEEVTELKQKLTIKAEAKTNQTKETTLKINEKLEEIKSFENEKESVKGRFSILLANREHLKEIKRENAVKLKNIEDECNK